MKALLLTIPQAVEVTNRSKTALYDALSKGELSAVKAGRRTLIPVAALEAYLASLPAYKAGV